MIISFGESQRFLGQSYFNQSAASRRRRRSRRLYDTTRYSWAAPVRQLPLPLNPTLLLGTRVNTALAALNSKFV